MGEFIDEELFLERLKETFPMKVAEYPELKDMFTVEGIFEEYKEYNRQRAKDWYERNREKKLKYQKDRYYNMKKAASDADKIE